MKETKKIFKIEICVEKDGDRFYAFCPGLKGIHVDGETAHEATENIKTAIQLYIKSLIKHGDPIPLQHFIVEDGRSRARKSRSICSSQKTQDVLVAV